VNIVQSSRVDPAVAARKITREKPIAVTPKAVERRSVLRADLIAVAEKTIAAKGLTGLNARDLAVTVGCSLGAIYNVFPHLDAIVFEVNSRTLALFEEFVARRAKARKDADPVAGLVTLAEAYLDFAVGHQPRWHALFDHRVSQPDGLPESYLSDQARLFLLVERPLAAARPDLDDKQRTLLARTMFSAVHGIVSLSLDAKLPSLPTSVLSEQVRRFVGIVGAGLIADAPAGRRR
jgi:AcrR family transcriptional regulator